jgi:hypothetical protein
MKRLILILALSGYLAGATGCQTTGTPAPPPMRYSEP